MDNLGISEGNRHFIVWNSSCIPLSFPRLDEFRWALGIPLGRRNPIAFTIPDRTYPLTSTIGNNHTRRGRGRGRGRGYDREGRGGRGGRYFDRPQRPQYDSERSNGEGGDGSAGAGAGAGEGGYGNNWRGGRYGKYDFF